ncbi:S41 family peptidase [soil metagenome]
MRKQFLLTAMLMAFGFVSKAQTNTPSWLRYPSISPDGKTIVFTYKGDLYKVPATGGVAVPLTLHEAHDYMPVWSHDGKYIAFASDRYGNFDIFMMPVTGGEAKRLTFHSANEFPYDFSADDKSVIFGAARMDDAANREYPTSYMPELYKVPVTAGRVQQILTTPAEDVKMSTDGKTMLYHDKKGQESAWRKHHVSSVARDIWMYDAATGKHTKITSFAGEDRNPIFADNEKSIYYLSESSGTFNVHKLSLSDPASSTQVTNFKMDPVRFLSASNDGTLCFSYNGDLYTKGSGEPQKLSITIAADLKSTNEKIIPVSGNVRSMAVSPNGKEVAFIFRGEVFTSAVDGSTTKRITNTAEQETTVSFSPDGKSLLYASERGDSWKIYQTAIVRKEEPYFYASTVLKETPVIANDKENYEPSFSPDGKEIAFIENRNTLKIYNIASKQVRTLLTAKELFSMGDNDQYFQWSPDSKWLAVQYSEEGSGNGEMGLIAADGKGKLINLTESGFNDVSPKWAMGGKMLLWFTDRDGLKSRANSGGAQYDVYAMFLTQEAFDQFKLNKDDAAVLKDIKEEKEKADTTKKKDDKKDSLLVIDWDGLKQRKVKLTIASAELSDALVSKDGENLYYLARFEDGFNLWTTSLRTKETKILANINADNASMEWDKEQKSIFLSADGGISKVNPESGKQERVKISSEMNLDVAKERAFMFEHVWRRTKETFYTAGYHGAQWDALKKNYEKFLLHIGDNYEFAEMLSEMLGELNVSHCNASYFKNDPSGDITASLGIFYDQNFTGNGIKIDEVVKDGPLDKAGFAIKPGMIITKIDGEIITPEKDFAQFLNRKVGKNTLITVMNAADKTEKEYSVKPISIGEQNGLLYKRWVRRNEAEVDKMSNGTLGYVHIPGMNDRAYRTTYEEVMGKFASKKALVVDTRNNGGGDLVSDLAMFLSGKTYLINATDNRVVYYEPSFRWNKPSIALANESNYSDGHCFAFSYIDLKLGKLVGMPVPGTCTFAGWEGLQDNSMSWGVPPLGVKSVTTGKYLENWQTEPDIKQMNEYEKVSKGEDQQLEAAVKELMK